MDRTDVSVADSGISSNHSSEMESVTSSSYIFREYKGRKYHGIPGNPYFHPCDESERSRLDGLQYIFRSTYGHNVMVPIIKKPTLIIDVGTGSGAWPIEVANRYPTARVVGMDLAPLQPLMVPSNCEFVVGDLTEDLVQFHDGTADLVQSRLVHAGVQKHEWPKYIQNVFRILKPGNGYAQLIEFSEQIFENNVTPEDCVLIKFRGYVTKMMEIRNTPHPKVEDLRQYFVDAGFTDINIVEKLIDIGGWNQDRKRAQIGQIAAEIFGDGIPALVEKLDGEIPDDDERKAFGEKAFKSGKYHSSFRTFMITGRKPSIGLA